MGKKKEEKKAKSGSPLTTLIVALISSIIFFLIGVEVGKEYAIREGVALVKEEVRPPLPVETIPPPENRKEEKQEKVDINFYDQLMKEGDQELNVKPEETPPQRPAGKKEKPSNKEVKKDKGEKTAQERKKGSNTGSYALQVAAFRDKERAARMADMLRREGYTPHIIRVTIPGKPGTYYRIWVGFYQNLTEASQAKRRLLRNRALRISRATIVKR